MAIDASYFIGEINIPSTSTGAVSEKLGLFISEYTERILTDQMGYTLYNDYNVAISGGSPAQKWLDIRDGKTYEVDYNGTTYEVKWNGLENTDKRSLLSYLIYFYWVREGHTQLSGIGMMQSTAENSKTISPRNKMVDAWNRGIELYGQPVYGLCDYYKRPSYYRSGTIIEYNSSSVAIDNQYVLIPSLYNFIKAMNDADSTTYPNWLFKVKNTINKFDL